MPPAPGNELFVGRSEALAQLKGAAGDVAEGHPRFVLVEGPAGVGKTTLVQQFARTGDRATTIRLSGLEAEAVVGFAVASQLLRELGVAAATVPPADADPSSAAVEMGGLLLGALGAASDGPLHVVLDDAHWFDEPSIHAIAFAFRRLDADAVLFLVTSRTDPIVPEPLGRLADGARGRRIHLDGLTPTEVGLLAKALGRPLSVAATRRLTEHTGGLPLHTVALLRELDGDVLDRATAALPAPRSFATMVLRRVARMDPDAQRLVEAAAVLGDRALLRDVAAVAGIDDPLGALDVAVAADVLVHRPGAAGVELVFSHALLRAALLDAMAPGRRAALHLRCATVLGGVPALEHLAAATPTPDADLAAELRRAGRNAVPRGSIDLAVRLLLHAARLEPDPGRRRECRVDALDAAVWGGALVTANALAAEFDADLVEATGNPRVLYVRGHLALLNGRQTQCEHLLLAAWQRCHPDTDRELASLVATRLAQLYNIFGMSARTSDAVTWAERSFILQPSESVKPRAPNAIVLVSLVLAGRPDEARARALSVRDTDVSLAAGGFDDVLGRGIVALWTDDLDGAVRDLRAASTPVHGHRPYLVTRLWALGFLADAHYRAGRWDESVATAELATSLGEDAGHAWLLGVLHGVAALPLAGRGDWEAATRHVAVATAAASAITSATSLAYAATAGAALAAARHDPAGVVSATDQVAALDPGRGAIEPGVMDWCSLRVEALAALSRVDDASRLADQLLELARSRHRSSALVAAYRALGVLAATRGDDDEAARLFASGQHEAASLAMPFLTAQLQLAHGGFLRRHGSRRAASELLRGAFETFTELRARPYLERVEHELEACGLAPRRRGPQPPSLTAREHAIARLVADGLTNREIAERLVVSVKTVEYHLANAFTKLDLRTRTQLAQWLAKGTRVPED